MIVVNPQERQNAGVISHIKSPIGERRLVGNSSHQGSRIGGDDMGKGINDSENHHRAKQHDGAKKIQPA